MVKGAIFSLSVSTHLSRFVGQPFGHLFMFLMDEFGVVCMGLNRRRKPPFEYLTFVFTNPPESTIVASSDLVYCIAPREDSDSELFITKSSSFSKLKKSSKKDEEDGTNNNSSGTKSKYYKENEGKSGEDEDITKKKKESEEKVEEKLKPALKSPSVKVAMHETLYLDQPTIVVSPPTPEIELLSASASEEKPPKSPRFKKVLIVDQVEENHDD
jgi:hypothetical protein